MKQTLTTEPMERENRYLVLKVSDIRSCLDEQQQANLAQYAAEIDFQRSVGVRRPLKCVVVENDWPEYERVWAMIEARVKEGL